MLVPRYTPSRFKPLHLVGETGWWDVASVCQRVVVLEEGSHTISRLSVINFVRVRERKYKPFWKFKMECWIVDFTFIFFLFQ